MTDPLLEKLIRFQHPDRVLPFARNLSESTLAAIFGADEADYRSSLDAIDRQRIAAAGRLAADPDIRDRLSHLPFRAGDRIVAIGESVTADRLSWFELLRTLITSERPELHLQFENLAVSGSTSTQALAALPAIRMRSADWLFCMLGNNDSQRLSTADESLLVSRSETVRNLTELRARALPSEASRWVWLTPTPVDEAQLSAFPFFRASGITWSNADIVKLSAAIPRGDDPIIDSAPAVVAAGADAFIEDGVHPSIATHEALTARVVVNLTDGTPR